MFTSSKFVTTKTFIFGLYWVVTPLCLEVLFGSNLTNVEIEDLKRLQSLLFCVHRFLLRCKNVGFCLIYIVHLLYNFLRNSLEECFEYKIVYSCMSLLIFKIHLAYTYGWEGYVSDSCLASLSFFNVLPIDMFPQWIEIQFFVSSLIFGNLWSGWLSCEVNKRYGVGLWEAMRKEGLSGIPCDKLAF